MPSDTEAWELYIDGAFEESSEDECIEVEYPYIGTVWASVPAGTPEDVDRAVTAARQAFEEGPWADTLPSERASILHDIADVLDEHAEELAELETRQNGKLIREMSAQMNGLGEWYRYYASQCRTQEGRTVPVESKGGEMTARVRKEPRGVVAAITPWNSPLLLTTFKLAPALAAGCTFVHKPSSYTPVSALRFAELLHEEAGLPEGVYNVITGSGSTVGDALTSHDDIDKVAFTGSTEVGRHLAAAAGEQLVPASLELGGKSPNVIFPSANLNNAINGVIKGIFAATGQARLAGSRVFIHEAIRDEFVDRFTDRAGSPSTRTVICTSGRRRSRTRASTAGCGRYRSSNGSTSRDRAAPEPDSDPGRSCGRLVKT